jgi:proline iminopeptidase
MNQLRADPAFQAGDIDAEAEYYRIHFGTTLRDPDQLEEIIRRLRSAFTEAGVVAARVIEDKLYEDTWLRDQYDLIPALGQLDIPTLVIHGADDFVPIECIRRIGDAIPGSRLIVLPDCGHFAHLEQPDLACTSITAFLHC